MSQTFVTAGDRVRITEKTLSGRVCQVDLATVREVHADCSDMEFANVDVAFDNDQDYGPVPRWIAPGDLLP